MLLSHYALFIQAKKSYDKILIQSSRFPGQIKHVDIEFLSNEKKANRHHKDAKIAPFTHNHRCRYITSTTRNIPYISTTPTPIKTNAR